MLVLREQPVRRPLMIPFGRRLKIARHQKVLLYRGLIEFDAESRLLGNRNEAFVYDRLLDSRNQVTPPRNLRRVIFEREEVVGSRSTMHIGERRYGRTGKVHRHADAVSFGHVTDQMGL